MTTINTTTQHLAARMSLRKSKKAPFFGHFEATYPAIGKCQLAFEAICYAYVGSPVGLQIWHQQREEGKTFWEPFLTLTTNHRPNDCELDEIIVKTYEENEPLRSQLLALGYFEDTGKRIPVNFCELEVWRLTQNFVDAFDTVHPQLANPTKS